jgi:hypothetical protein
MLSSDGDNVRSRTPCDGPNQQCEFVLTATNRFSELESLPARNFGDASQVLSPLRLGAVEKTIQIQFASPLQCQRHSFSFKGGNGRLRSRFDVRFTPPDVNLVDREYRFRGRSLLSGSG